MHTVLSLSASTRRFDLTLSGEVERGDVGGAHGGVMGKEEWELAIWAIDDRA